MISIDTITAIFCSIGGFCIEFEKPTDNILQEKHGEKTDKSFFWLLLKNHLYLIYVIGQVPIHDKILFKKALIETVNDEQKNISQTEHTKLMTIYIVRSYYLFIFSQKPSFNIGIIERPKLLANHLDSIWVKRNSLS